MTLRPDNPRQVTVQTWSGVRSFANEYDAILSLLESLTPAELHALKTAEVHREQKRRQGIGGNKLVGTNAVNGGLM